jgi:hypothetical protein
MRAIEIPTTMSIYFLRRPFFITNTNKIESITETETIKGIECRISMLDAFDELKRPDFSIIQKNTEKLNNTMLNNPDMN